MFPVLAANCGFLVLAVGVPWESLTSAPAASKLINLDVPIFPILCGKMIYATVKKDTPK